MRFYHLAYALFDPAFVFELTVLITVVQAGIDTFDLVDHPLMDAIVLTALQHHLFQRLEILGDGGLMALYTVLQLGDDTDGLASLVDQLEGA